MKRADLDDNTDSTRLAAFEASTRQRLLRKDDHAREVLAALTASTGPMPAEDPGGAARR